MSSTPSELGTVLLRGFPLDVFRDARRHSEGVLREFAFIVDGGGDNTELPRRLLDIVTRVRARSAGLNAGAERALEGARDRGDKSVDFELLVPLRMAAGATEFADLLDAVDEYCQSGQLLTLATPPEIRDFRRWYLHELAHQVEGEPPTSWPEWRDRAIR
ncbi:MAG TPA: hypothetical protein VL856_12010 [Acidimicrobiia bacterium]|jgi:hypothetical protein|nr:hypothetical protein [Acidimicrobiia bacterium]